MNQKQITSKLAAAVALAVEHGLDEGTAQATMPVLQDADGKSAGLHAAILKAGHKTRESARPFAIVYVSVFYGAEIKGSRKGGGLTFEGRSATPRSNARKAYQNAEKNMNRVLGACFGSTTGNKARAKAEVDVVASAVKAVMKLTTKAEIARFEKALAKARAEAANV